jgi:hypothetical protein
LRCFGYLHLHVPTLMSDNRHLKPRSGAGWTAHKLP